MRRAAFAAGLAVLCAALARGAQAADPTHVALVDQTGARFTFADLRGGPVIVTFVATRCSDACPIADSIFARLAQRNLRARLVTITLDPRYDTPFVMAHYARELGADRRRWII